MFRSLIVLMIMLSCIAANAAGPPSPMAGIERSDLFLFAEGDRIEDAGRLNVTGGRFNRIEDFEVVRTADGGRILTSITTGADGIYRVKGRWRYDADEQSTSATGLGLYDGQPVIVEATRANGLVTLVATGALSATHIAACAEDCLIDMSPSALPMFSMTRLFDEALGGAQYFRWVARSLIVDQVLLDGKVEIRKLGDFVFRQGDRETPVKQYAFVESLKDEASGQFFKVAFNLYVTDENRPLAFATGGTTVGERAGYEGITKALPPEIPATK
jgi:hypothetical protein